MAKNQIGQSKVHLIGVGGIGMSGIAEILVGYGAKVSGSDLNASERTAHLEKLGVKIFVGHQADQVQDVDVVVYSSAIPAENPELLEAQKNQIPCIARAEALAELMRAKRGIAIAGTHGKTTTTSMTSCVFESGGLCPTVVSGGIVIQHGSNARMGSGEWFVAEADESDGSFEKLSPEISVITNIDNDHIEFYGDYKYLIESFKKFADRIPFYGTLIYCGDDQDCRESFSNFNKKAISYGFDEANEFRIKAEREEDLFTVFHRGEELGNFKAPLTGKHNALNALAAIVAALRAGLSFEEAKKGMESFQGVRRRFELKLDDEQRDYRVFDDYAHHPTEIMAVLSACKAKFLGSRIRCVFQPHRYSRLKACWEQFTTAFDMVDELYLMPVYAAGEKENTDYNSESLSKVVTQKNITLVGSDPKELAQQIKSSLRGGDLVITLGAGDVYKVSDSLVESLKN